MNGAFEGLADELSLPEVLEEESGDKGPMKASFVLGIE